MRLSVSSKELVYTLYTCERSQFHRRTQPIRSEVFLERKIDRETDGVYNPCTSSKLTDSLPLVAEMRITICFAYNKDSFGEHLEMLIMPK